MARRNCSPCGSTEALSRSNLVGYKRVRPNEIVLNRMQASNGMFFRSTLEGLVSPDYAVFRPIADVNCEFLAELFRSAPMRATIRAEQKGLGTGTSGFLRLYSDRLGAMSVVLPPRDEQDQIVAFLRAQDVKLGRLVRAKQRTRAVLLEQRDAALMQLLTGRYAAGPRRDSGAHWLSDVPTHWQVRRLKHAAQFNPSRSESMRALSAGEDVAFVPMGSIGSDGQLANLQSRSISEVWNGFSYFRRGDVVMAKITPCFENGKGGWLHNLPTEIGFGTTEFLVMRPRAGLLRGAYLAALLSLQRFRQMGAEAMTGAAGQQRVPTDFVKNFMVPLPPVDEQDAMTFQLQALTAPFDAAIAGVDATINAALEYRTRLIADVVTGQHDVRGWQPGPGDVTDDAEAVAAWGLLAEGAADETDDDHSVQGAAGHDEPDGHE
jgi:type I restriction enzyme S subunit